ncbi:NfeD family protein [Anaerococcus sp. DFU013_CI05]|uniref:NfeD family protein n=1 Tax=unclassified Anaerococcus TaxID=2614126 RepID=UPI001933C366|nr:NfeD family protein [Anaerococcus sp. mt242]MBM0045561.1 peptidase [Anaerococcus sp. mt242]
MLANDLIIALSFVLAVIFVISILFTEKKVFFGILALLLFGFFYYQNTIYNVADNMTILTFIMGITLLALEIFIPSFGVIGIVGIILTIYSVMDSFADSQTGILILVVSALAIVLTVTIYVKLGFDRNLFDRFILTNTNSSLRGYNSKNDYRSLIGKIGVTKTILRPTGRIEIEGTAYDAKSNSDFIGKDKDVEVVAIKDGHIIVKEKVWNS